MTRKIRVLVVDDSPSVRRALINGLSKDRRIEVVGFARDGIDALERVQALEPDVVTLDVEMPRLNGVRALERIMAECPTPVVMVSSITARGAKVTIEALELGAVDFVLKKASFGSRAVDGLIEELTQKIRHAATANVKGLAGAQAASEDVGATTTSPVATSTVTPPQEKRIVVIASSTGGPQALRLVIPSLPGDLPVPVLIVQHLPAGFTARLSESLDRSSALTVEEAHPGSKPEPGRVLIAPGGLHMVLSEAGAIKLTLDERECGVRPAANPMMESVAAVYGASTLGVVLTGMGSDGTRGAGLIKEAGGEVIVEHEATCVVYGMPKSVVKAGYADRIVPLPKVASEIALLCPAPAQQEQAV